MKANEGAVVLDDGADEPNEKAEDGLGLGVDPNEKLGLSVLEAVAAFPELNEKDGVEVGCEGLSAGALDVEPKENAEEVAGAAVVEAPPNENPAAPVEALLEEAGLPAPKLNENGLLPVGVAVEVVAFAPPNDKLG